MTPAMALLRSSAGGPAALEAFLEAHELTPQLAEAVRELFVGFLQRDQLDNAELAVSVLPVLWLRLGNWHEVLRSRLDHLQVRFKRAEEAQSYAELREHALDTLRKAVDLDENEFAFRAAVLAADASFFGYGAGGGTVGLGAPVVLADLVAAAHRSHRATGSTWLPRFVSLLAAAVQRTLAEELSPDEQRNANRSLRQLATEGKALLPAKRHFPDDQEKAAHVDVLFSALITKYG